MYKLLEVSDIFADACVRDDGGNLLFASLYGRDGALLQLMSAFSLKRDAGGLDGFTLVDDAGERHVVSVPDVDRLDKLSGRLPKANLFGNLAHTWLYDKRLVKRDYVNRIAWVIDETSETKEFWKLRAGTMVSDTSGERFALTLAGEGQGTRRFKLKIGKAQPCEAVRQRSRCMVSTESLKESPPLPGWVQKKVRILGPVPANADVYVAGFQAHALGNNQWEFWGKNGSNLKALIIANGRIIHSEAFKDSPGNALILKMAQNAGKNRAH